MNNPSLAYAGPFVAFVALMGVTGSLGVSPTVAYPLRSLAALAVWWVFSRNLIRWRPSRPLAGALLGVGVFLIWISPELVWPGYREHWLFDNALTRPMQRAPSEELRRHVGYLLVRSLGSTLLVPVIEELFWRGWLMRWLVAHDFTNKPLGEYCARSFWITAALFALEHGAHWDVGLAAGIAYNWWLVRTRNLADCVVAHGVTNACLAGYVLGAGTWSYWARACFAMQST